MNNRDVCLEMLAGINKINNFKQGKNLLKTAELSAPKKNRLKRQMTQLVFAVLRSVSMCTLQENINDD